MRIPHCTISILAATSLISPLLQAPAHAGTNQGITGFQEISILSTDNSLEISWNPIPGATEYVAYEELPKQEHNREILEPIHRGPEPHFDYLGLGPREVSRIRILAIDENERVLARSLVRTSTSGVDNQAKEVNWIASGDGVEVFLGQQDEEIPLFEGSAAQHSSSNNVFFDESFSDETKIYQLTPEEQPKADVLRNPDSSIPQSLPINHVVEVPGFPIPEKSTLDAEVEEVWEALVIQTMARRFEWEAFIEDDHIPAPILCDKEEEDLGPLFFGGDDRDFSRWTTGQTNRFVMSARADFNWPNFVGTPPAFVGWRDPSSLRTSVVGETVLYEQQEDGSMERINAETAPRDELDIDQAFINRTTAEFFMVADSTNPLCSIFQIFDAPAINVSFSVIMHTDGSYSYSGARDAAPNHQAVIDTYRIQTYPSPTFEEYMDGYNNFHTTCVHKHTNVGFSALAFPPVPVTFNNGNHSDPSANGDCSTVDP